MGTVAQTEDRPQLALAIPDTQLVVVDSSNPTKLAATQQAFESVWPSTRWRVESTATPHRTKKPLLTGSETYAEALLRAQTAVADPRQPLYGVGIVGGVFRSNGAWMECSWVIVLDQLGGQGTSTLPGIRIPEAFVIRMMQGETLGEICDDIFGREDVGTAEGYFGLMTNNAVTRTSGYVPGISLALAVFVRPDLFRDDTN